MPVYRYTAITAQNKKISGTYEAASEREVMIYLRQQGWTAQKVARSLLHANLSLGNNKVKIKDLLIFTRMFATMAKAAVPITQALGILLDQTKSPTLRRAIQRMIVDIEKGNSLSDAMKNQAPIFEPLYYSMIAAGEQSGNLDTMLERLAYLYERTDEIRGKIKGAMIYPAILFSIAVAVVVIMLVFVVPQFVSLFSSFDTELPEITQIAIEASDYLTNYWWMIILEICGAILLFRFLRNQRRVAELWDRMILHVGIIGPIVQKSVIARFTRTLATLLASGIGILEALELTAKTAGNAAIAQIIREARTAVSSGSDLAGPLRESKLFPSIVTSMVAIGEQAGEIDIMLDKVADFYEAEVNNAIDGAIKLIEPMMLVVMGSVVGFIMASLYLPMFDLIGNIK